MYYNTSVLTTLFSVRVGRSPKSGRPSAIHSVLSISSAVIVVVDLTKYKTVSEIQEKNTDRHSIREELNEKKCHMRCRIVLLNKNQISMFLVYFSINNVSDNT